MSVFGVKVKGIVEYNGKYLLLKHWYDDCISNPYQWEFVDGKIDYGENPDQAVLRLIKTHAGIDATISQIMYTWSYKLGEMFYIGIAYQCLAFSDDVILSEEMTDYQWVEKEELPNFIENEFVIKDLEKAEFLMR